jgi:hypothetical protein
MFLKHAGTSIGLIGLAAEGEGQYDDKSHYHKASQQHGNNAIA